MLQERKETEKRTSSPSVKKDKERPRYQVGETLWCYDGPDLYPAKCMKLEHDGKMYSYLIHYNGWSKVVFYCLCFCLAWCYRLMTSGCTTMILGWLRHRVVRVHRRPHGPRRLRRLKLKVKNPKKLSNQGKIPSNFTMNQFSVPLYCLNRRLRSQKRRNLQKRPKKKLQRQNQVAKRSRKWPSQNHDDRMLLQVSFNFRSL